MALSNDLLYQMAQLAGPVDWKQHFCRLHLENVILRAQLEEATNKLATVTSSMEAPLVTAMMSLGELSGESVSVDLEIEKRPWNKECEISYKVWVSGMGEFYEAPTLNKAIEDTTVALREYLTKKALEKGVTEEVAL